MAWLSRLRNVFRSRRLARDIDEEIGFHVAMRAEQYAAQGLPADEAAARARRVVGNPLLLRERTRDADVWVGLDTLRQDVLHSLRVLGRNPGFTAAAGLTLALGIGANTAVWSVVDAVLVKPLPYPQADRLYVLYQQHEQEDVGRTRAAPLDFLDWQRGARSFAALAAHTGTGFTLTGSGEPELVLGQLASSELFDALGVAPRLGRTFRPAENEAGRDRVMVLSHGLWQRRFGGDPRVVGRTTVANGEPYTIVGVMPPGFGYPAGRYQLWVPFPFRGVNPEGLPVNRNARYLSVVGRLRPGVPPAAARAELAALGRRLARDYPTSDACTTIGMAALGEETVGEVRPALLLLFGAAGFVLLIACANVSSLLLARAGTRRRELAVRSALGGGTARLVRQLLTETAVLFGLGAAAGLLVAYGTLGAVRALGPQDIPRLGEARLDLSALAVTAAVAAAAALVFGLLPALTAARAGAAGAAGMDGRAVNPGPRRQRLQGAVIVAEVGLALLLLAGAGLASQSLLRLLAVDLGFEPDRATTFDVVMTPARFPDAPAMRAFYRRLLTELARPPLAAVGLTTHLPLSGQDMENGVTLEGTAPPQGGAAPVAGLRGVSPGYFAAMGIPVRRGRAFTAADREDSQPVALVNESFARRYWPGQEPLGRRLLTDGPWRTVVGVVADVKHRRLDTQPRPEVLVPYVQLDADFLTTWARGLSTVVRSAASPAAVTEQVHRGVHAADPGMPVIDLRPMRQVVADSTAQARFRTLLLGGFAAVAFALALVGVFGVMAYFVTRRTGELAVRAALGARPADLLRHVLGRGAGLAGLGVALGLAGALGLTRFMASLLFEVSPTDPAILALATAALVAAALLASALPARRAARIDPATVLRQE